MAQRAWASGRLRPAPLALAHLHVAQKFRIIDNDRWSNSKVLVKQGKDGYRPLSRAIRGSLGNISAVPVAIPEITFVDAKATLNEELSECWGRTCANHFAFGRPYTLEPMRSFAFKVISITGT
jgi:hypothetical protein